MFDRVSAKVSSVQYEVFSGKSCEGERRRKKEERRKNEE